MQGKKAIVISVPVPQIKAYQKIQTRLVRELEKKFNGKPVVFIAQVRNCYKILYEFPLFTNNVILLVWLLNTLQLNWSLLYYLDIWLHYFILSTQFFFKNLIYTSYCLTSQPYLDFDRGPCRHKRSQSSYLDLYFFHINRKSPMEKIQQLILLFFWHLSFSHWVLI